MWIWALCPSLALGAEDHTSVLCSAVGTDLLGAVSKHLKSLLKVNARELCRMWNP